MANIGAEWERMGNRMASTTEWLSWNLCMIKHQNTLLWWMQYNTMRYVWWTQYNILNLKNEPDRRETKLTRVLYIDNCNKKQRRGFTKLVNLKWGVYLMLPTWCSNKRQKKRNKNSTGTKHIRVVEKCSCYAIIQ